MAERDVIKESDVMADRADNSGSEDAVSRDRQKISILRSKLENADIDMLVCTYEMIIGRSNFFETEEGALYVEELKSDIDKRNTLISINRKREKIIATVMSIVAVICIIGAIRYGYDVIHEQYIYRESQEGIDNLKIMLDIGSEDEDEQIYASLNITGKGNILKKYHKIYMKNKDFMGWVSIPGTQLDYPVMQSDDNEYYLKHDFEKKDSEIGLPFLDMRNDADKPDDNLIIYGHNLKNGNMFGSLKNYLDKDYYEKHPVILFDTLYEKGKYEIVFVALSRAFNSDEEAFRYYDFINARSEKEFSRAVKELKKIECYSTGKKVKWGDSLITLSTCNDYVDNGRLFVMARKIQKKNDKQNTELDLRVLVSGNGQA